jgi:hypothetical protein
MKPKHPMRPINTATRRIFLFFIFLSSNGILCYAKGMQGFRPIKGPATHGL